MLWEQREKARARLIAVASILGSAAWAYELLERTPHWNPWLRPVIVALAVVSSGGLLLSIRFRNMNQKLVFSMAVLGVAAILTGPIAFTADTISTAHTGALPAAGPAVANTAQAGAPPGAGGATGGGARFGSRGAPPQLFGNSAEAGHPPGAIGNGKSSKLASLGAAGRGGGSPGAATQVSHALKIALHKDASSYRWVAATSGSNSAASLELATDDPVMAIGGFNNQAEKLNLSTFEGYVNAGEIHYYIAGGGNTGPGGGNSDKEISKWVEANFKSETIGGQTVYNLSSIK
jgi:hypothetical protein